MSIFNIFSRPAQPLAAQGRPFQEQPCDRIVKVALAILLPLMAFLFLPVVGALVLSSLGLVLICSCPTNGVAYGRWGRVGSFFSAYPREEVNRPVSSNWFWSRPAEPYVRRGPFFGSPPGGLRIGREEVNRQPLRGLFAPSAPAAPAAYVAPPNRRAEREPVR